MNRLSFRPRPLDINKKLRLLKTLEDFEDEEDSVKIVQHGHVSLDGENETKVPAAINRKGPTEIPTPRFEVVESYTTDYTATFKQPASYVRSKPARSEAGEFVEYDLDDDDDDWLSSFNMGKILLPEMFEWMLYKLEILDHKQRERAGLGPVVLGNPVPVMLQREQAFEVLRSRMPRQAVLTGVYDYWKNKPAPSVTDTNPFNVFRPREKVHRPHTRRMQRRENDVPSFDKLRQVRRNLQEAKQLVKAVVQREKKKKELAECERDLQQAQLQRKHDLRNVDDDSMVSSTPQTMHPPAPKKPTPNRRFDIGETAETTGPPSGSGNEHMNGHWEGSDRERERRRSRLAQPIVPPVSDADVAYEGDQGEMARTRKKKRKRNAPSLRGGRLVKKMMPANSVDPVLLFTQPLDLEKLTASGIEPPSLSFSQNGCCEPRFGCRGRIGRGGRIIFDRWDALQGKPLRENSPFSIPPPSLPSSLPTSLTQPLPPLPLPPQPLPPQTLPPQPLPSQPLPSQPLPLQPLPPIPLPSLPPPLPQPPTNVLEKRLLHPPPPRLEEKLCENETNGPTISKNVFSSSSTTPYSNHPRERETDVLKNAHHTQ